MAVIPGVQRLLRVGRNTGDLDRTTAFYRDALGFRVDACTDARPTWMQLQAVDARPTRVAMLTLGAQQIELTEFPDAEPYPADGTSCDLYFQHCAIVTAGLEAAFERVMQHGATPITQGGPQRLPPSTGSVGAFKFRDPDGHPLELIEFPPGTGDPVWHTVQVGALTLGIDHSAISVGNAARSTRFYQLLGLHVAAHGVNCGPEQQRLDHLDAVEVDVIAMQAGRSRTPHLELLGYRHPRGCNAPASSAMAIGADRLVWQAAAIEALLDALAGSGFANTRIARGRIGTTTVALLRDPDGHLQVLTGAAA